MARFAYVNGRFLRHEDAVVHIEDRGFQFADGVYEVVTILGGRFVDAPAHLARLSYSLRELSIEPPVAKASLTVLMRALVRMNGLREGVLYLQVTRGVAPRDFKFPRGVRSTLVMTTRRMRLSAPERLETGVAVVTVPDIRWARRDIKSTGLLAQVLAKQKAVEQGGFEAWMVDPAGFVTEGASSNAWILTKDGKLVTRPTDRSILHGVTGNTIEHLAAELGISVERRPFTVAEAMTAREAFVSSATTFCLPVVAIDGRPIANGHPGEITRNLASRYWDYARGGREQEFPWRQ
jgi:D-alanine transaminase